MVFFIDGIVIMEPGPSFLEVPKQIQALKETSEGRPQSRVIPPVLTVRMSAARPIEGMLGNFSRDPMLVGF